MGAAFGEMGATIALVVYYLAAILAMGGALLLWRDLSLRPLSKRVSTLAAQIAEAIQAHATELQHIQSERASERHHWIGEFQHAREHIDRLRHELSEARNHAATRWQAYDLMSRVWLSDVEQPANEEAAKSLLRQNMWVLEPEYRLIDERIDWEVKLTKALTTLYGSFGVVESKPWREEPNLDQLVDIAAVVSMEGTLGTLRTHSSGEALLLIEAKRPGPNGVLNEAARDQVLRYAADLRKIAPDILTGRRIECLLIGGRIPDRMNDVVVRWDSEGEAPTMVRFLTWETLLKRAERACELSGPRPDARPHAAEPQAMAAQ